MQLRLGRTVSVFLDLKSMLICIQCLQGTFRGKRIPGTGCMTPVGILTLFAGTAFVMKSLVVGIGLSTVDQSPSFPPDEESRFILRRPRMTENRCQRG